MVTRDFDAMLAEKAGVRPTFKIGGQEFRLRAKMPFKRWNGLVKMIRETEDGEAATRDVLASAIVKADRERFLALLDKDDDNDDDDDVIDVAQMDALVDWVMEIMTGKRLTSSDSSSPGANSTGESRNVVSLNARNGT